MSNPNFSYYVINRNTKFIVAGFDCAADAHAFMRAADLAGEHYQLVPRSLV